MIDKRSIRIELDKNGSFTIGGNVNDAIEIVNDFMSLGQDLISVYLKEEENIKFISACITMVEEALEIAPPHIPKHEVEQLELAMITARRVLNLSVVLLITNGEASVESLVYAEKPQYENLTAKEN